MKWSGATASNGLEFLNFFQLFFLLIVLLFPKKKKPCSSYLYIPGYCMADFLGKMQESVVKKGMKDLNIYKTIDCLIQEISQFCFFWNWISEDD